MSKSTYIILATNSPNTNILYNFLIEHNYLVEKVILEKKESKKVFLKRRIKKLGFLKVLGQILFKLLIANYYGQTSKKRIQRIILDNKLNTSVIPNDVTLNVDSINSEIVENLIQAHSGIVIVNGTRIIGSRILSYSKSTFINLHLGITPSYRGVYGAYWALINDDKKRAGTTLHYVDEGIDTGKIISRSFISDQIERNDNVITYPCLQFVGGLGQLLDFFQQLDVNKGFFSNKEKEFLEKGSQLYYHPTIWFYLYYYFLKGIK